MFPSDFGLRNSAFFRISGFGFRALPLLCVLCGSPFAIAQLTLPETISARSYSGQFTVVQAARPPGRLDRLSGFETNRDFVRLQAALLPVSCERIKQFLWRDLGVSGPWQSKIIVSLYPASSEADTITLASERFRDGWQYRLALPDLIERPRYVRTMVQVLLLELANRHPGIHPAEIPAWLSEGLTQHLLVSDEKEIIVSSPPASTNGLALLPLVVSEVRRNPLAPAHTNLCAGAPLSFQQLSWPPADPLEGEAGDLFRNSAQLFVTRLLELPNGKACLRAMIAELPQYYNWQFAFLHAFRSQFQRPLEVEKWWTLQLVQFTGRDLAQAWPADESWQKLDAVIRSTVQVRLGTNELPLYTEVTLQTILREWKPDYQAEAFQAKLRELEFLRPRLAPEYVSLAEDYRRTLAAWLQNRNPSGVLGLGKHAAQRRANEELLRQLDGLDARRKALQPAAKATVTAQAPASR